MLNAATLLEDSARRYPSQEALILGDTRLTYAQVDAAANRIANLLVRRGVRAGDKVALSSPNIPWFPIVYYGILKAGAVVVPLNVLLKAREVAYHLNDSQAVAYFCFEGSTGLPMGQEGLAGFRDSSARLMFVITADTAADSALDGAESLSAALADMPSTFETVATDPSETACILFSSGTTGESKGAELSHANVVLNALTCNRLFESRPVSDTHLVALPLFHSFGATVQMHAGFSMGATLHLVPRFDAGEVIRLMERVTITFFAGVPTMWWGLIEHLGAGVDVERIAANLRIGVAGGSSLPVEVIKRAKTQLGVTILEGYGLSETSPVVTFSDPDRDPRPGSIGVPVWGVEVRLIDSDWSTVEEVGAVGEIAVRGHNVMTGYYNRSEQTAAVMHDGWFRTGDLARVDQDGFYYVVDRAKDMVIRGGFNVYPREIEEVLMTHPGVSLATVIGVPHESHGEEVKAFVIPVDGAELSPEDLVEWSKEQMAAYKYPRIVEIVSSLPMTATGKILKRELS